MHMENTIIIGGGPCGMSCAIELQMRGINPLIIEKENIVNTIFSFPTHQVFFSSSEKLEIGDIAFITEKQKPVRSEALAYYRAVANRKRLRINSFEKVTKIHKVDNIFQLTTKKSDQNIGTYQAENVIIATGYYDQPNYINVPGEELPKVMHYFKEAHPYYDQDIVVIGGKNSAIDAALELHKSGARITVLYRGSHYSDSIKPWILPEFDILVKNGAIALEFNANVTQITNNDLFYSVNESTKQIKNDFVFAMTGYQPNLSFLKDIGVSIHNETGRPDYNEDTYETNLPGIYVAGVVASGFNNNEIFIENGRFHGESIAKSIAEK